MKYLCDNKSHNIDFLLKCIEAEMDIAFIIPVPVWQSIAFTDFEYIIIFENNKKVNGS
jgi:hypothetical protein